MLNINIGEYMNIKIADKNDIENIFILNKLFKNDNAIDEMNLYFENNKNEIICIAYIDNIPVGFCTGLVIKSICYKNKRMDIETLYVKEEYRQKGIGEKLIKYLEEEALLRDIKHFHIITNDENINAIKLYEKNKYKKTGEILLDKTLL